MGTTPGAACYFEQMLEATPHKKAVVRPFTSHLTKQQTRFCEHCWRSKDELINDIPLWTPIHGYTSAGQPAKTYTHQL